MKLSPQDVPYLRIEGEETVPVLGQQMSMERHAPSNDTQKVDFSQHPDAPRLLALHWVQLAKDILLIGSTLLWSVLVTVYFAAAQHIRVRDIITHI